MPSPNAVDLHFLGVAKETTQGTAVAPTNYIPVKPPQPVDKVTYLTDQGLRGSMVTDYGKIAGVTQSEFSYGGPLFPDSFGWCLAGVLGDVTTTGASAPYTHAIAVKNNGQPKPYTLTHYDGGLQTRAYAGQMFSEVGVKFSAEGFLEYTAKSAGWASVTAANPTSSWTTITPLPAWLCTATIGGSSVLTVETAEISIKRPVNVIHTAQNTQAPFSVFAGPVAVSGKMSVVMTDESELTRYLTNTQPAVVLDFTQGAAAALVDVKFQMSKCAYTAAQRNLSKDFQQLDITFNAVANTTDVGASGGYSPILATLKNALAASTYV